jgi:hypothetical protein
MVILLNMSQYKVGFHLDQCGCESELVVKVSDVELKKKLSNGLVAVTRSQME